MERIPDRASDAVWKHKDISYRHDRVGHGAGNRTLRSGRQSMYLDTVLPPSLLDGNGKGGDNRLSIHTFIHSFIRGCSIMMGTRYTFIHACIHSRRETRNRR